ncbi:MAG: hypothetical protein KKE05_03680, partial [Nanoarchaeota archaeon]|nr:hypothetical protein [Nanoarchaeota archaeon]
LALMNSEISLLDEQIRSLNIETFNVSCDLAVESTFSFADRIYQEAQLLEKYDSSSKFTDELKIVHRRYDLLRTLLWAHSIETKNKCPQQYHTVVYLFDYASEDFDKKARQAAISRLLTDIKGEYGNSILLIPIAANLELESINLIKERYSLTEAPAIIIDEHKVVTKDITFTELRDIIFEQNNYEQLEGVIYREYLSSKPEKIILNTNKQ